jgi:hypothetical protein
MTSSKPTASRTAHSREAHERTRPHVLHAAPACPRCGSRLQKKGDVCLACQLAELQRAGWHL